MLKRFLVCLYAVLLYTILITAYAAEPVIPDAIPGDPFGFRICKLENGLTLILSRNTKEPRISTYIAVRAGSVQDPAESTGLAHYFEHLMFKGTSRIASLDYAKERPILDKIELLFEQHRKEKDPEKRKLIYKEIDRLSGEAAKYANDEYWNIVRALGAKNTNAFTSHEVTAYINDIPSNMLERFLTLEAERFSNISLRRFHTELETVYEEFNRSQDNDSHAALFNLLGLLYPAHPFGRPIIGLPEHLKNPSVKDVAAFFKRYYVPENIFVILSGDLEFDKAVATVNKTLGKLPSSGWKRPADPAPAAPLKKEITVELVGPQAEFIYLAYRFPRNRKNDYLLDLVSSVLHNGKCGLMDVNLLQPQKVQSANCESDANADDNLLFFSASPLPGQSLEELRDLILAEVDKLKSGKFDASLLTAAVNNDRFALITGAESYNTAADFALQLFCLNLNITDILSDLNKAEKATPEMVAQYARENLKNYVCVLKRNGVPNDRVHAVKPPITPVEIPGTPSIFAGELQKIPAGKMPELQVVDHEKQLTVTGTGTGYKLYSTKNKDNERFSLSFEFPAGSYNDLKLALLMEYARLIGTDKHSLEQFNRELYNLAASISFSCSARSASITLSGMQRNFEPALRLLQERIRRAKVDVSAYEALVKRIEKSRKDSRKYPASQLQAATSFALYGTDNPFKNAIPADELRKIKPEALVRMFRELADYPHDMVYYGPEEPREVANAIARNFPPANCLPKKFPDARSYCIRPAAEPVVYFLKVPTMTQVLLQLIRPDEIVVPGKVALAAILTRYAGQYAFSELREKQSLGYVAKAQYAVPSISPENYSLFNVHLGTQPDKLQTGMNAMKNFADNMPMTQAAFDASKKNILSQLMALRCLPEEMYGTWKYYERMKRPYNQNFLSFQEISKMELDDFRQLTKEHCTRGKDIWVVVGNCSEKELQPYGKVIPLSIDDLFVP